jgi:drug/metabolite transporter (DMT)-like permease
MTWQIAIVLHGLLSACNFIVSRSLGKSKVDFSYFTNVLAFIAVFVLGLMYVAVTNGEVNHAAALAAWPYLVGAGLLFSLKTLLVLRLFIYVPASVGSLMTSFNLVVGVLLATVLLNEGLSFFQVIGLLLMVLAIYTIRHTTKTKKQKHMFATGILIAVSSALLLGVANVTEKYLLDRIDVPTYLIYGWGFQLLGALCIAVAFRSKFQLPTTRSSVIKSFIYAVLVAVSGGFFIYTLVASNNASLTIALSGLKVVFAMILSYVVLKERSNIGTKLISVFLSVGGVYLLMS